MKLIKTGKKISSLRGGPALSWPGRGERVLRNPETGDWTFEGRGPLGHAVLEEESEYGTRSPGENMLILGENLFSLNALADGFEGKVGLIYIDPPFNTGSRQRAYADTFNRPLWLSMMEERLREAWRLLSENGSMYVHLDSNEVHYAKVLMDQLFGTGAFQREITWRIGWTSGFKSSARNYIRNHDTILYYTKSEKPVFNKIYLPYPPGYERRKGAAGRGLPMEDTWNCSEGDTLHSIQIKSFSKEKTGFQTQKNEDLLWRIISVSSNPGDLVLDFFSGSGTTASAAHKLGRRWIACEADRKTVELSVERLKRVVDGRDPYGITKKTNWKGGGGFSLLSVKLEDGNNRGLA